MSDDRHRVNDMPLEEVPRWTLNHAFDLLVRAVEMVDDLDGLSTNLQDSSDDGDPQTSRVLRALDAVVRSVQAHREEDTLATSKTGDI